MAFGAPAGELSRKTNNSAQVADKLSNVGKITDQTTHGAAINITKESYADAGGSTATSGQTGVTVITQDDFDQIATDYAKNSITTRTVNI